jgi:hypothetical protein
MANRKDVPKPENGVLANKIKNIDPEVAVRKSRRQEGKLPDKVVPLYLDMQRVNEKIVEEEEEEIELSSEYQEPLRSDKRTGVNGGDVRDLPYKDVKPVDPVSKQNVPRLNVERMKGTKVRPVIRVPTGQNQERLVSAGTSQGEELLDADVTLKLRDLLAAAPTYREKVRIEASALDLRLPSGITGGRREVRSVKGVTFDDEIKVVPPRVEKIFKLDALSTLVTEKVSTQKGEIIRVVDPVLQYLQANPNNEARVMVGAPVMGLRSVLPVVNEVKKVECILDNGSTIVSMSKVTAVGLGLGWNPKWKIYLESANNTVNRSLGVSENVPFRFNHITVHLQVHVLEETAYEILLGRPFDCLTRSIVQNFADGSQIVVLTSPHTGDQVVIPTYDRGKIPPQAEPFMRPPEMVPESELPYPNTNEDDVNFR